MDVVVVAVELDGMVLVDVVVVDADGVGWVEGVMATQDQNGRSAALVVVFAVVVVADVADAPEVEVDA